MNEEPGPHLLKAINDRFDYALGLKSGAVMRFSGAGVKIDGNWLVISGGRIDKTEGMG